MLIIHGSRDRVASPERSAALARRLSRLTEVTYVAVEGGTHAMLRHHERFVGPAVDFVVETLLNPGRVTVNTW